MSEKHYLDRLEIRGDGTVIAMIISCPSHTDCIEIYHDPEGAVEKLNKVLKGLNEDEES